MTLRSEPITSTILIKLFVWTRKDSQNVKYCTTLKSFKMLHQVVILIYAEWVDPTAVIYKLEMPYSIGRDVAERRTHAHTKLLLWMKLGSSSRDRSEHSDVARQERDNPPRVIYLPAVPSRRETGGQQCLRTKHNN